MEAEGVAVEVAGGISELHHIIRSIARDAAGVDSNAWLAEDIEAYLKTWFDNGWRLYAAYPLGENPNAYHMLYILVR